MSSEDRLSTTNAPRASASGPVGYGVPRLNDAPTAIETSRWINMVRMIADVNELNGKMLMAAVMPWLLPKAGDDFCAYISLRPEERTNDWSTLVGFLENQYMPMAPQEQASSDLYDLQYSYIDSFNREFLRHLDLSGTTRDTALVLATYRKKLPYIAQEVLLTHRPQEAGRRNGDSGNAHQGT